VQNILGTTSPVMSVRDVFRGKVALAICFTLVVSDYKLF